MQDANTYIENNEYLGVLSGSPAIQEFGNVLSNRLPALYRSAYRLLGNPADAEDAVQDGLLNAYKHLDQFKGESQMSTWLTAIVNNAALMQLRTRQRHKHVSLDEPISEDPESSLSNRLADDAPSPEEKCRDAQLSGNLRRLTSQLSPTLLKTFQLRDVEGLSIRETAQILRVPNGTVKAQLARARKRLKQRMQGTLTPQRRNRSRGGRKAFVS